MIWSTAGQNRGPTTRSTTTRKGWQPTVAPNCFAKEIAPTSGFPSQVGEFDPRSPLHPFRNHHRSNFRPRLRGRSHIDLSIKIRHVVAVTGGTRSDRQAERLLFRQVFAHASRLFSAEPVFDCEPGAAPSPRDIHHNDNHAEIRPTRAVYASKVHVSWRGRPDKSDRISAIQRLCDRLAMTKCCGLFCREDLDDEPLARAMSRTADKGRYPAAIACAARGLSPALLHAKRALEPLSNYTTRRYDQHHNKSLNDSSSLRVW